MNRLKSSMLVVLAVVAMLSLAMVPIAPVNAQGSAALSIPPRKDYTIEPGKDVNDTLLIRNIDKERPLYLSLRVVDFTHGGDGGTPKLLLDENEPQTPWSLRSNITLPEMVTVEPDSSASIDMNVSMPKDHEAGSYYSAIVFSSSSSEGGNVGLSASGVSLVFVTIPGTVNEKLTLEKLGAYDTAKENKDGTTGAYARFNLSMPIRIGYTLKNEGNVAESPVGSMTLKNILFGREVAINDINPSKSLALIGQTRTFTVCMKTMREEVDFDGNRQEASGCSEDVGLWPGIYTVNMNSFYGWNGNATQEVNGKSWFIYTPWWFIAIVFIVLLFISYYVWRIIKFIRIKTGKTHTRVNKR
jgi:hypothetical protein